MNDIETILMFWERNGEYGIKLTDGLSATQFVEQPLGEMNHAAWVLSHLNTYHRVLDVIIRGRPLEDPADEEFGMKSKPVPDASRYASPDDLREAFTSGHQMIAERLRKQGPAVFDRPVPLERWRSWLPTSSAVIANLMIWHETLHLGQLSAWRRAMDLPPVSFLPIPTAK
ncbi:MAG: DinB family protein [Planctomycetota bacterium]